LRGCDLVTAGAPDPSNPWKDIVTYLRAAMSDEDFRRWFAAAAYASDSGDQITVWVPSEAVRRHIQLHFRALVDEALDAIDRSGTQVRFLVAGTDEDDE
jgi:chromosomal replication initiation ATPase DnaA